MEEESAADNIRINVEQVANSNRVLNVGLATQMMEVWVWVMEVVKELQLPLEIRWEFQGRQLWI